MSGTPGDKVGPLTVPELLAIWSSAVDTSYRDPLIAAGDGDGLEAYTQAFVQLARVSKSIDRSTQALFLLPFSGQTSKPAEGPANATVTLTFARTTLLEHSLILGAGTLRVDEQAIEPGEDGGIPVNTGRRYVLSEDVVFFPGETSRTATATAEKPGYGYNAPLPGSITIVEQVGADFANVLSQVVAATSPTDAATLITQNEPDTFVPDQVGSYVRFTAGANVGRIGRIVSFIPPDPLNVQIEFPFGLGSVVGIEEIAVVACAPGPAFVTGETVTFGGATTGTGTLFAKRVLGGELQLAIELKTGSVDVGTIVMGDASSATATVLRLFENGSYTSEGPVGGSGGASWRILSFVADWGLSATNAASPTGGRGGMLDLQGADRGLPRSPGEGDGPYRVRVSTIADVVVPNAIRRAINRSAEGDPWCFREVGSALLPGFFFDRFEDLDGDAYDNGSLLFSGSYAGSFAFQEPCEYHHGIGVVARGVWGSYVSGPGALPASVPSPTASAGAAFTLSLTRGRFDNPFPVITPVAGDVIVGLLTGASFSVSGAIADTTPNDKRWSVLLDYAEFRGFFVVGVPPRTDGEFGFEYDEGDAGGYDLPPSFDDFYDGFPATAGAYFGRVWAAVESVRAGGVGWELVRDSGPC